MIPGMLGGAGVMKGRKNDFAFKSAWQSATRTSVPEESSNVVLPVSIPAGAVTGDLILVIVMSDNMVWFDYTSCGIILHDQQVVDPEFGNQDGQIAFLSYEYAGQANLNVLVDGGNNNSWVHAVAICYGGYQGEHVDLLHDYGTTTTNGDTEGGTHTINSPDTEMIIHVTGDYDNNSLSAPSIANPTPGFVQRYQADTTNGSSYLHRIRVTDVRLTATTTVFGGTTSKTGKTFYAEFHVFFGSGQGGDS